MYSTQNLTIGFESLNTDNSTKPVYAIIYYKGFQLFNCWKNSQNYDWPGKANKWELNRADLCLKYDYTPSQYLFDRVDEMLRFLENEFCKNYNVKTEFIE